MKPPRFTRAVAVIVGLFVAIQASAQSSEFIFELIAQNDLKQAQKAVNSALKNSDAPADLGELQFANALIADKKGQSKKAIGLYLRLIESHPGMMGPYNNLAIHYANEGDYKSAVSTLEKALKANQSVATTYENLQSIYARMASLAYRKALDSDTPTAPLKLAAIEDSGNVGAVNSQPTLVASAESYIEQTLNASKIASNSGAANKNTENNNSVATVSPQNDANNIVVAANTAVTESSNNNTDNQTLVEPPQLSPAIPEPALPVVEDASINATNSSDAPVDKKEVINTAALATKPTKEAKKLAEQNAAEKQALINHVKSWASAWSDRDVDRYLSHYSAEFKPRDNMSLEDWKKQRYGRLRWREFIIVKPSRYRIDLDDDLATMNFSQYYKSERFEDTIRKTLKLKKENGKWQITQEFI